MNSAFPVDLRAVIFDLDGTLYEQAGLRRAIFRQLAFACARNPKSGTKVARVLAAYRKEQELMRHAGEVQTDLGDRQLENTAAKLGMSVDAVGVIVDTWMQERPISMLKRFRRPGVQELLARLRRDEVALGILSDYPVGRKLEALGLECFFSVVLTAQDRAVGAFKPNPAGLLLALDRLRVRANQALYIGDRHDVDAPAADNAGVACVIVGSRSATQSVDPRTFRDFHQINAALGRSR